VTRITLRDGELNLFVSISGSGPPLLWVAGLGDDHTSWSSQIPHFERDFTCVAFDNRGCGQSDTPDGPYTIKEMAEDVHLLVSKLDLGPVAAVGSSMGGAICQEWAAMYGLDVSALVLTNTWPATDNYMTLLFDHWIALASQGDPERLAESLLLFSVSGDYLASSNVEEHLAPIGNIPGFAAAAWACRGHDALARLSSVTAPTLVVAGTNDILTRPALAENLASAVPGASLELIEAGHMVFWERPDEFNEVVGRFLERPARRAG
jgi:3-oxoadipate enol-lactonase